MTQHSPFLRSFPLLSTLAAVLLLSQPSFVQAGCGCDKAPPVPAQVRPHATYPGRDVTIFAPQLQDGHVYEVTFTSGLTGESATVATEAVMQRDLADSQYKTQVVVPLPDLPLGPTRVRVAHAEQDGALVSSDDAAGA